jgi:hypothetical protein
VHVFATIRLTAVSAGIGYGRAAVLLCAADWMSKRRRAQPEAPGGEPSGASFYARSPFLPLLSVEEQGTARTVMSQLVLQVLIVVAFSAFCFGCGYLTAFVVTRNQWRDEMIKRGVARYNWHTGKWEWGEPPSRPY